jgi:NAD(P)-dependent dehydrogenase (short-subunit alcohol dehydrogenase family)
MTSAVAIITGAFGGLGQAICLKLALDGFTIAALDRPDTRKEDEFGLALEASGIQRRPLIVPVDVTDPDAVNAAFAQVVKELGRIDVLVNNAGIREIASPLELTPDEWNRVVSVNLTAPFLCAQAAARDMVSRGSGGSIINISSVAGLVGLPSRPAYTATKHGLLGLTKSLAYDLGRLGIRVNAICPGLTTTPLTETYAATEQMHQALAMSVPMGGTAEPRDIAEAVAFLASSRSRFISGISLAVDGAFAATKTYDPAGLSETFAHQ